MVAAAAHLHEGNFLKQKGVHAGASGKNWMLILGRRPRRVRLAGANPLEVAPAAAATSSYSQTAGPREHKPPKTVAARIVKVLGADCGLDPGIKLLSEEV